MLTNSSNKRVRIDELSDSSSSDDEADEVLIAELDLVDEKSTSWQLIAVKAIQLMVRSMTEALYNPEKRFRAGNKHRDRAHAMEFVHSWSNVEFYRQFRLEHKEFYDLLTTISNDLHKNEAKAKSSSGSFVSPEMMLFITLRILAGASYLDMIWYQVSVTHINDSILYPTLRAIDRNVSNINFPFTEGDCRKAEQLWEDVNIKRHGVVSIPGLVSAGDGLVAWITMPSTNDLLGRNVDTFWNRKGFYGLVIQGFCDAYCRFQIFDIKWPGATNDIVAYKQTTLYALLAAGLLPPWALLALDEAYSSCGGVHLTPFTKNQLRKAAAEPCQDKYLAMLGFNCF